MQLLELLEVHRPVKLCVRLTFPLLPALPCCRFSLPTTLLRMMGPAAAGAAMPQETARCAPPVSFQSASRAAPAPQQWCRALGTRRRPTAATHGQRLVGAFFRVYGLFRV